MATILIPTPLRQFAGGRDALEVRAATVGAALGQLVEQHPEIRRNLYTDAGRLRAFVNVYVDDDDIRYLDRDETALREGSVISIVPSIAGGSPAVAVAAAARGELPAPTSAEILRCSRHLVLPEVGLEGRWRLKAASVLTGGAGGLGAPLDLRRAAAGVGGIGIVDFDRVDETNLQRQVIHGSRDLGRPRIDSAAEHRNWNQTWPRF